MKHLSSNQKARNKAILVFCLGLVVFLYILSFIRVQQQPWSLALKKKTTQHVLQNSPPHNVKHTQK